MTINYFVSHAAATVLVHTGYLLQFSRGRNVAPVGKAHPFLHICFLKGKEHTPLHSLTFLQQAWNCITNQCRRK